SSNYVSLSPQLAFLHAKATAPKPESGNRSMGAADEAPSQPSDGELVPGSIIWVNLAPTKGREQAGHRPALVISGNGFLGLVTELVTVVPITSTDRGWPNHIPTGSALNQPSWVMTEQIRTISRDRITSIGS